ncbi:hypothetical protein, partial [Klebsiella pneumoniae]|uniref:hypothetical protein n=1 Tax=Klebsiella pneumoniae TaxID=573 RepID=UPI001D0F3232
CWLTSHFFYECCQFINITFSNGFLIWRERNFLKIPMYGCLTFKSLSPRAAFWQAEITTNTGHSVRATAPKWIGAIQIA